MGAEALLSVYSVSATMDGGESARRGTSELYTLPRSRGIGCIYERKNAMAVMPQYP